MKKYICELLSIYEFICESISIYKYIYGFPCGSDGKESACNTGHLSSIPGLGRSPGEINGNPLQCSCLENPMDRGGTRRNLVDYSPWGRKESDMTEQLHFH